MPAAAPGLSGRIPHQVISLFGPAGAGKSSLAKALVAALGETTAVRVPGDYFQLPGGPAQSPPYQCDWPLLLATLAAPAGTLVTTPPFDFTTFARTPSADRRQFILRSVLLIDMLYPAPVADAWVFVTTDPARRRERIAARDLIWETRVQDRWESLETAHAALLTAIPPDALRLDGAQPLATNVAAIRCLLASLPPLDSRQIV